MLTQQTIDSLRALRLPAMSQAYAEQTVPTLEHFDGEEGSCQRSTREAEQRVILTNPAPRALPEPASGNTLYVPLLEVIHWKCPSSLRSDNRVQSIGTNGPNTSGYLPNDFVAGCRTLLESPAECVGIRRRDTSAWTVCLQLRPER